MVESLTVFLLVAVIGATSAAVSEFFHNYLHYLGCLAWQTIVLFLDLHHIENYQNKISNHLGALLDLVGLDARCRTFKHKDASWDDGRPQKYIFLGTPTWSDYIVQCTMLGHWIFLPHDVDRKTVSMCVTRPVFVILSELCNKLEAGVPLDDEDTFRLREILNLNVESKGLWHLWNRLCGSHKRVVTKVPTSNTGLVHSYVAAPVTEVEAVAPEEANGDSGSLGDHDEFSYVLLVEHGKYVEQVLKRRQPLQKLPIYFSSESVQIFAFNCSCGWLNPVSICNHVKKSPPHAQLWFYIYNPDNGLHLNKLRDLKSGKQELNILLYFPPLELLDMHFPVTSGAHVFQPSSNLCAFIALMQELRNCGLPYLSIALPYRQALCKELDIWKWLQHLFHNSFHCVNDTT